MINIITKELVEYIEYTNIFILIDSKYHKEFFNYEYNIFFDKNSKMDMDYDNIQYLLYRLDTMIRYRNYYKNVLGIQFKQL
jgi:hypothetical protein